MLRKEQRSTEELTELSRDLVYEVKQMRYCLHELQAGKSSRPLHNTFVTAFAIHARNIYAFLYRDRTRLDDAVAGDYFDVDESWAALRPRPTPDLADLWTKASRWGAHLSYERVGPEKKRWEWTAISQDLLSALKVFVCSAPAERLHADLLNLNLN